MKKIKLDSMYGVDGNKKKTNAEYLQSLKGQNIPPMFKMYKLWCHTNDLQESNLMNFKAWLEDRIPEEV